MSSVVIYWDYQNVSKKELADSILNLARCKGKSIKVLVFDNWNNKLSVNKYLQDKGFECINVTDTYKNAVDFELFGYLNRELVKACPNEIILITGDNYALTTIKVAHKLNVKITVIGNEKSSSTEIKNKADKFYTPEEVIKKYSDKTYDDKSSVDYYKASYYLIKYVKFCQNQKKPPTKDIIINFLTNYFQNNGFIKNFPIVKEDGTQFTKLSKFIEAASQDGIITLRDGQIFLG